jgi:hypothetical protein
LPTACGARKRREFAESVIGDKTLTGGLLASQLQIAGVETMKYK